jgi:quercetin 2,3-dioxygenase
MKKIIHKSEERGTSNLGWLQSNFSFSFANYHDPKRMGFGALRVLNDDIISGSQGFGFHPHSNMEIITIVEEGELLHRDSMNITEVVKKNDVQVMSAGSGIVHSEFNNSETEPVKLLQIWINTKEKNIPPSHDKKSIELKSNELTKIVSGKKENTLYIHQDAEIYLGEYDEEKTFTYELAENKGVFIFVMSGEAIIEQELLKKRDSVEISETNKVTIDVKKNTKLLLIDVPMR